MGVSVSASVKQNFKLCTLTFDINHGIAVLNHICQNQSGAVTTDYSRLRSSVCGNFVVSLILGLSSYN